eukprot:gene30927-1459_t
MAAQPPCAQRRDVDGSRKTEEQELGKQSLGKQSARGQLQDMSKSLRREWHLPPDSPFLAQLPHCPDGLGGRFSPVARVGLPARARAKAHIPLDAYQFAFAFPSRSVGEGAIPKAVVDRLTELTIAVPPSAEAAWALFGGEHRWCPVTAEHLMQAGAKFFCWLTPDEAFPGYPNGLPFGGFVYLFRQLDARADPRDCFFRDAKDLRHEPSAWKVVKTGTGTWSAQEVSISGQGLY